MEIKKSYNNSEGGEYIINVTDDIYAPINNVIPHCRKYFFVYRAVTLSDALPIDFDRLFDTPQEAAEYLVEKTREFLLKNLSQLDSEA